LKPLQASESPFRGLFKSFEMPLKGLLGASLISWVANAVLRPVKESFSKDRARFEIVLRDESLLIRAAHKRPTDHMADEAGWKIGKIRKIEKIMMFRKI
jgi:hypothetical protein